MGRPNISNIVNGRVIPRLDTAVAIVEALGYDLHVKRAKSAPRK